MAYTALYRKYRPLRFDEMVGQEHIIRTLKNQIIAGRVGHAYLLNGGRGTGKTSAAKILARAINCLDPQQGEPCNKCEVCKAALDGTLTDIVEMDAASNNSVEDVRSIREEVNFLPTFAKYRVYIIDEVHMLSTGAFNALLKTLEEPPIHVKFILATTEPQKLPVTILSRCQRFDFKKIPNSDIQKRLKYVCEESNIKITEEALNTISVLAEGAMRDALSILERCVQEGDDNIDNDKVKELVGIPKLQYIYQIVSQMVNYNIESSLEAVQNVLDDGKDLTNLIWEIIKYVKDILIYKTTKKLDLYSEEEIKQIDELSSKMSKDRLLKMVFDLSELENKVKTSSQKTLIMQVGIMKLCNKEIEVKNVLKDEVVLEEKSLNSSKLKVQEKVEVKREVPKKVVSTNLGQGDLNWNELIIKLKQEGKIMLYTNLINSVAQKASDATVEIVFPNGITPFGKSVLEKPENINELTKIISMECGKAMNIKYIDAKDKKVEKTNCIEDITNGFDMPINIIDE